MIVNSQRFAQETAATPGAHDLGALPLDYGIQLARMITAHLPPDGIVFAEVDEWTLNSLAGRTFSLRRDTRAPDFSIAFSCVQVRPERNQRQGTRRLSRRGGMKTAKVMSQPVRAERWR